MPTTARSWFLVEPKAPLQEREWQIPDPAPTEAVIEVQGNGLCHTDLGFADGGVRPNHALPLVLGEPTPIFNDGPGVISNIGVARYGTGSAFPGTLDTGPENRYHAGSFTYSPNPEPGTIVLLSSALAAAGVWRRRRVKRQQAQS